MSVLVVGLAALGPFLMFAGVLLLVWLLWKNAKKRAEQERLRSQSWAQHRGWLFYPKDQSLIGRWPIPLFNGGTSKQATNVLTGPVNSHSGVVRQALSFQYQYTVSNGKSSTTYYHHVVCVFLPNYIPTLTISPEGVGAKLAKLFGGQDIQFESEEFNRQWRIVGQNLSFAHAVVHPQTMDYLMRHAPRDFSYYLTGDAILIYGRGKQVLENIDSMAWHITDLIDLVPEFVWQDYSGQA